MTFLYSVRCSRGKQHSESVNTFNVFQCTLITVTVKPVGENGGSNEGPGVGSQNLNGLVVQTVKMLNSQQKGCSFNSRMGHMLVFNAFLSVHTTFCFFYVYFFYVCVFVFLCVVCCVCQWSLVD